MVRLADDRIDHVGRRHVGGLRGGDVGKAGPGDHAGTAAPPKAEQRRRGTDAPQVPRRVHQPQRHRGHEPEPADQEMEIGRQREQQRRGGQPFPISTRRSAASTST